MPVLAYLFLVFFARFFLVRFGGQLPLPRPVREPFPLGPVLSPLGMVISLRSIACVV